MKHQITVTKGENGMAFRVVCTFEDAMVAQLIADTIPNSNWDNRGWWTIDHEFLRTRQNVKDNTITLKETVGSDVDEQKYRDALGEIVQALTEREIQYLPIVRYFNGRAKAFNENLKAYYEELDKRLNALEYQMKVLGNHCKNNDERITGLAETARDLKWQLNNHCDKVGELDEEVTALQKFYEGLHGLFFQHVKQRFHFSRRGEKH